MAEQSYTTLAHYAEFRYEEKRSVFIGEAIPCEHEEDALAFIARVRARFPDARHHVYAYLLRENAKNRYSDDHEPQGTAGMPVLDVIRKNGCTDTAIVVTRYFGGVLLGAGGLVRAYTAAAAGALKAAGIVTYRVYQHMSFDLSYSDYNKVVQELEKKGVRIIDTAYAEGVTVTLSLPVEEGASLADAVTDQIGLFALLGRVNDRVFADVAITDLERGHGIVSD